MTKSLLHDSEIPTVNVDAEVVQAILRLRCVAKCPLGGHLSYKWRFRARGEREVVFNPEELRRDIYLDGEKQELIIRRADMAGYFFCVVSSSRTNKIAISQMVLVSPSENARMDHLFVTSSSFFQETGILSQFRCPVLPLLPPLKPDMTTSQRDECLQRRSILLREASIKYIQLSCLVSICTLLDS